MKVYFFLHEGGPEKKLSVVSFEKISRLINYVWILDS